MDERDVERRVWATLYRLGKELYLREDEAQSKMGIVVMEWAEHEIVKSYDDDPVGGWE